MVTNPSRPDKYKMLHVRKINSNCKYIEMVPDKVESLRSYLGITRNFSEKVRSVLSGVQEYVSNRKYLEYKRIKGTARITHILIILAVPSERKKSVEIEGALRWLKVQPGGYGAGPGHRTQKVGAHQLDQ